MLWCFLLFSGGFFLLACSLFQHDPELIIQGKKFLIMCAGTLFRHTYQSHDMTYADLLISSPIHDLTDVHDEIVHRGFELFVVQHGVFNPDWPANKKGYPEVAFDRESCSLRVYASTRVLAETLEGFTATRISAFLATLVFSASLLATA